MTEFYGFTVHGQIVADSEGEAEGSGSQLVNALLVLDFVTAAETWISLTPEADVTQTGTSVPADSD